MTLSRSAVGLSILIAIGAPAAAAQPGAPEDPVGRHQQCSGGLDLLGIGVTVVRALMAIRARSRDD